MQPDAATDLMACRAMLCTGSRSFHAASRLLPRRVRDPATALYAFCRVADDLIDETGDASALHELRARLGAIYAGWPADAAPDRALARVVRDHAVPRALLDALLEGFAWDAAGRRYEDLAALHEYAARVAGSVGAMMAVLMGARDPEAVARACDLGIAMQLSNIARDVGEDARAGRIYLPLAWLRAERIDPDAFLADPRPSPALARVVQRLVGSAEPLYARARSGIAMLPLDCRPGIGAASRLYRQIGRQVLAAGGDSVSSRAVVSRGRKLRVLARSVAAAPFARRSGPVVALAAVQGYVIAVQAHRVPVPAGFDGRAAWLYDLFTRLDAQKMASR